MAVATYSKSGTKAATAVTLDKKIFGLKVNDHQLIKEAYLAYLANGRSAGAKTKNRGDVSGGGRKPWRQKGTGNARFGSSRNPIWRGGGIAFGPTGEQNYTAKLSVQATRQALRQALSLAVDSSKVVVIEDLALSTGKTKDASALLAKIEATGFVMLVVDNKSPETIRAIRNLANVVVTQAKYLNVFNVLNADKLVFTKAALGQLGERLGAAK